MNADMPEWTDSIAGNVKTNGKLHIYGDNSASEVITSDYYVRP